MSENYIANLLGNKNIYPVTVKEMVEILKPLIDDYRQQACQPNNQYILNLLVAQIKLYHQREPVLFARSRRYLRHKRKVLLRVILNQKKLKQKLPK